MSPPPCHEHYLGDYNVTYNKTNNGVILHFHHADDAMKLIIFQKQRHRALSPPKICLLLYIQLDYILDIPL